MEAGLEAERALERANRSDNGGLIQSVIWDANDG